MLWKSEEFQCSLTSMNQSSSVATCHHATPWLIFFFFDNALTCGDYQEDSNPRPQSCGPRVWSLDHPPGLCLINVFDCITFSDISLQNSLCKVYASKIVLSKYQVRLASTSILWIIIFSHEAKKKFLVQKYWKHFNLVNVFLAVTFHKNPRESKAS